MRLLGGAITVLLLLVLLTFLLLRGIWTDEPRYALELKAFDDLSLGEASLRRHVLEARAGLLRNYDAIVKDVEAMHDAVARLRAYARERGLDAALVERVAGVIGTEDALTESFKTDNAVLQNSLSYFGLLSISPDFVGDKALFAQTAGALAAAVLRLTLDSSPESALAVERQVEELERQAPSSGPRAAAPQALIVHARLLYDLIPAVDAILKALVADRRREPIEALRAQFLEKHADAEGTAQRFRLLLYALALLLLVALIYVGMQLRARALALRIRASFEHIIAQSSTQLISIAPEETGARLTHVLGALCRVIGIERAYIVLDDARGPPHVWSAAGAALASDWPQRVLALARTAGLAGPGITRVPDVARLPQGEFRDALVGAGVRAWACVPLMRPGRFMGIMAFDSFTPAWDRPFPLPVMRLAGDAVGNAIERKLLEREQTRLAGRLERASRMEAVGQFASGIAHNFNNIIAAILGHSELAEAELAAGSKGARHIAEIRGAAERGRDLIDGILSFGSRRDTSRSIVGMHALVEEAASLLRASLPKEIELSIAAISPDLAVAGEPAQLQQVILNLCRNASQAMQWRGRIDVLVDEPRLPDAKTLSHGELPAGSYVRLAIADTGPGIEKVAAERLFEPFFTTRAAGTGLGLATVREIVRDHDGAMNVVSVPNLGSRFEVWLPAADVRAVDRPADTPDAMLGQGEIVLVVENDRELLLRNEDMLAALGYEPAGFEADAEALAAYCADPKRFDAVVISTASASDGCALARELSRVTPRPAILLATTSAIEAGLDALTAAGVVELLRRPLVGAELAAALARCLRAPAALPL
jgi:signal transduction histidine kinase/CheY-like chemotaxis protein